MARVAERFALMETLFHRGTLVFLALFSCTKDDDAQFRLETALDPESLQAFALAIGAFSIFFHLTRIFDEKERAAKTAESTGNAGNAGPLPAQTSRCWLPRRPPGAAATAETDDFSTDDAPGNKFVSMVATASACFAKTRLLQRVWDAYFLWASTLGDNKID